MRILLIDTNSVRPGERIKAEALVKCGHQVTLLAPDSFVENYRRLRLEENGPLGYRLITGRMYGKPPNRTLFLSGLGQSFRPAPEAVLVMADENFWLTAQALAAAKLYAPRAHFLCHSWQNLDFGPGHFPQPSRLLYALDTWLERRVFRRAEAIMARNQEAVAVLGRRGYSGRLEYIPWGVDTDFFRPAEKPGDRVYTIGFVGRFIKEKGILDLLEACRGLEMEYRLLLVGSGPLEDSLRETAAGWNMAVEFVPVTPHEAMPELYAQMDVLVLPSRTGSYWKEQFGRVLVEAMASGVCVVASDSGAMPEVVDRAGLVFPEGDAPTLQAALLELADPDLRLSLAKAGLQRARNEFSWPAWAQATTKLLDELARGRAMAG